MRPIALVVAAAGAQAFVLGQGGCARSDRDRYYDSNSRVISPLAGDGSALVEPHGQPARRLAGTDPGTP